MKSYQTYDIHYDEEGDFLEVTLGESPKEEGTEQIEPGIFITKNVDTNEIYSIGILNFKKRVGILKTILEKLNISFPLKISI